MQNTDIDLAPNLPDPARPFQGILAENPSKEIIRIVTCVKGRLIMMGWTRSWAKPVAGPERAGWKRCLRNP
jgi:hypothetical protein